MAARPYWEIDKPLCDQPYYIVPNDNVGVEAFAVIREAMVGALSSALRGDHMFRSGRNLRPCSSPSSRSIGRA